MARERWPRAQPVVAEQGHEANYFSGVSASVRSRIRIGPCHDVVSTAYMATAFCRFDGKHPAVARSPPPCQQFGSVMRDFALEVYFSRWRSAARHHLTASESETLSFGELVGEADDEDRRRLETLPIGYTDPRGAAWLREAIADGYETVAAESVLCFAGAQEGIFAAMQALLGADDHAIVITPNYQVDGDHPRRDLRGDRRRARPGVAAGRSTSTPSTPPPAPTPSSSRSIFPTTRPARSWSASASMRSSRFAADAGSGCSATRSIA